MVNITTLRALAERLGKATGPSKELDVDITHALFDFNERGGQFHNFTASIDAALALVERLLPGWSAIITIAPSGAVLHPLVDETQAFVAFAPTPALAILRAFVAALLAKEEGNG